VTDPGDFAVRVERGPDEAVVHVAGEVDLSTGAELEAALVGAAREATRLVVDLTRCTFLSSTGLRALLKARRELGDEPGAVVVVAPDPHIRKVFEIAGVASKFELVAGDDAS
jgi:anti-anti-sigma factor